MIEICPTTAYYLLSLPSYADHPHLRRLLSLHYPVSIHTDDSGIFATNLTSELMHMAAAFGLEVKEIIAMEGEYLNAVL